jgi:DNA-binding transcriptional regulator GbsR (MarR family)
VAEPDIWKMFFQIAVERKKREFDPALYALRHLISEADTEQSEKVRKRLIQMEETFTNVNRIMNKFLEDENKSKILLNFFKSFTPK